MFIVIKSEHYDCTNLICKKDTLEEAVAALTPPTIEIVGFPGGGGKAYHHAAYKAASYAVSHHPLRV